MVGDQDSGEGAARSPDPPAEPRPAGPPSEAARPAFLPPADGHEPRFHPAYPPPYDPAAQGSLWNVAVVISGTLLLVSAFLPWAEARIVVDVFGRTLTRELGSVVGIEADTVVAAVPVLAMVSIGLAFWGLVGRDARACALAAVPGLLSLLVCALFVLRLDGLKDRLAAQELSVGYEVAVVTGWYLAVAMSLLVVGFSMAPSIALRIGTARAARRSPYPPPQYVPQQDAPPQGPDTDWAQPPQTRPVQGTPPVQAEPVQTQQADQPAEHEGPWQKPD
ncbi:hypothetical protein GCM10010191_93110 [Actinomadura vinacea]|uniref:Uncharacterized protein n=1 Tax=Actinomadura vinacea TaxID=115336 RepID=A0ABP5XPG2_9ACTN